MKLFIIELRKWAIQLFTDRTLFLIFFRIFVVFLFIIFNLLLFPIWLFKRLLLNNFGFKIIYHKLFNILVLFILSG